MISYINIKNIALIQELSLPLKAGLNILSGETGAGKSIIIDSINFVLGDRADRTLIRHGETTARVEVVFDNIANFEAVKNILEDSGIECDDETVIVNRLMTQDKSECRINGRIVNLSTLRSVVALLVDIHSQNEHQSLLKIANHIKLLDAYSSNLSDNLELYRNKLARFRDITNKLSEFSTQAERERKIDILTYQIEEIERVNWSEGEEETLNSQRERYYNSQKITSTLSDALENIDGSNNMGGIPTLKTALSQLNSIAKYDDNFEELITRLESAVIELVDIAGSVSDMLYSSDTDRMDIESIESRLDDIRNIKKKYGKTTADVAAFYESITAELDRLTTASETIEKLTKQRTDLEQQLLNLVHKLHDERCAVAKKFQKVIQANLIELGMKNSIFEVKIELTEDIINSLNNNGADYVEFMLSPNLGEPLKPLAKIASGGEMSRFMLALKNVIAELDDIDTLIFDEIDTGISGVIAKVVACKLYDIAKSRQVIAITHLPQLSSMADINFLIEKNVVGGKTLTFVKELDENETLQEIMRLSGFSVDSKTGLEGAKELKSWANSYKNAK